MKKFIGFLFLLVSVTVQAQVSVFTSPALPADSLIKGRIGVSKKIGNVVTQYSVRADSLTTNASNLSIGTLSDARLSNNVVLLNAPQTITNKTIDGLSNTFTNLPVNIYVDETTILGEGTPENPFKATGGLSPAGIAGGQTVIGGTNAGDVLFLRGSSSNGRVVLGSLTTGLIWDEVNGKLGVGGVPNNSMDIFSSGPKLTLTKTGTSAGATQIFDDGNSHIDGAAGGRALFFSGNGSSIVASFRTAVASGDVLRLLTSGNLMLGTTTDVATAIFQVASTTKASIPLPKMTKAQRDAIVSPSAGMGVYQTDNTPGVRFYNGTNWMRFTETAD